MDIVISYVNCRDKVWMKEYLKKNMTTTIPQVMYRQFYDHGTLKYILRGIDKYLPYVENIFLVVSNIEQVPDYINQSNVKIVLHKDFIPEEYLPLFNSTAIEMFLHKIPGLGEEFVYFNDDMIPISPIPYESLFKNGTPCINFEHRDDPFAPSYRRAATSFYEAKNSIEMLSGKSIEYTESEPYMPIHCPTPLLKSVCDEAANMDRHNSLLHFYVTPFKAYRNLNQYYWADLLYFKNQYLPSEVKLKYTSTREMDIDNIEDDRKEYSYICINDYGLDKYTLSEIDDMIITKLDKVFPDKCKYEAGE